MRRFHLLVQCEQDANLLETSVSHGQDGGVDESVRSTPVEEDQGSLWELVVHPFFSGDEVDRVQELGLQQLTAQLVEQLWITN